MDRPKAALPFGNSTLIERIVAELGSAFDEIVVAAAPETVEQFAGERLSAATPGLRLIRDETAFAGPVRALMRALEAIGSRTAFACSCDLPLLRAEVALAMCSMLEGYDAVIPEVGGRLQPLHAVYRRRCFKALGAMLERGENRLGAVAECVNARRLDEAELRKLDPELRSCFNVNSPRDYKVALRLAGLAG
jgi:molybdopterin-guanine dinucleotide biosynthesis protein A